jgi:hypothetical protein
MSEQSYELTAPAGSASSSSKSPRWCVRHKAEERWRFGEPLLASLLPGLRDLRVPLAAGLMWLVVLWLSFYPDLPTKSK